MELTKKQNEGLKTAIQRYKDHQPYTCIAGFAGSGKSTLVKFIIAALDIDPHDVAYIAYTGKAALVLKDKGCPNAMTAHRLLYQSFPRNDGTFFHKIKRPLDRNYKIIIVDEVSMLPKEMWDLLLSHNIYVIALGDPGQLPPIGDDNGVLSQPHIFLDEIMRQAQESEIIRLTMDIRDGKPLQLYNGEDIKIIDRKDFDDGMYFWADQVLVGKNDTRRSINNIIRHYLYGTTDTAPLEGDKVICLRNDWDNANGMGDVNVNGTIGTISNIHYKETYWLHPELRVDFLPDYYDKQVVDEMGLDAYFHQLNIDNKLLTTGEPTVNNKNFKKFPKVFRPDEFDYGYCITTHKAQGSEYSKVLVFEEWLKGGEHDRWLYTAATRAKDKLIIVRGY